MLFKLSYRNIKRSIKNYSIYFLTLTLGVCIFYIFNSLKSQTVMIEMSESKLLFVDSIQQLISMVSVFVSFILGFLVVYANNFIIKRRNREFGIYMTLGIGRTKISTILFLETIIIGVVSLVVGIFIGVFISQGLAGLTAKMFEEDLTKYKFIFSKDACIKTIFYFSIIFIIVMIFNFLVVSRYNLIDLINEGKKNQKLKSDNLIVSVILFILSIICLTLSYKMILENQLVNIQSNKFYMSILLGILGTVLFFRALAGFLIKLAKNNKNFYLKNLNTFVLRQLNTKINTTYLSMSVICIMLFISIGMTSTGISMKKSLSKTVEFQTPYDLTLYEHTPKTQTNLDDLLAGNGIDIKKYAKEYVEYSSYDSNIPTKEMFKNTSDAFLKEQLKMLKDYNLDILKLSDYNKLKSLQNKQSTSLKDNEILLITDMSKMKGPIEEYIKSSEKIKIGGNYFDIKNEYEYIPIQTSSVNMNPCTLVVNDKYIDNYNVSQNYISLNYKGDKNEVEKKVSKMLRDNLKNVSDIYSMTKLEAFDNNMGAANMFLYIGIYIGVVFLISSAAVLSLSQLSGAIESIERYKILSKLGVDGNMINKSIFKQILIYFYLPLLLALLHSIFGIKVANNFVETFGGRSIVGSNILIIAIILLVYSIYFVATYKSYKSIVKKSY